MTNNAAPNAQTTTYVPFIGLDFSTPRGFILFGILRRQPRQPVRQPNQPRAVATASATAVPVAPKRVRYKKGPKRIKKQMQNMPVTADQLDKEMEDYRAAADMSGL